MEKQYRASPDQSQKVPANRQAQNMNNNQNMSPSRININIQKGKPLNKISNPNNFVNHSQNFQNNKLNNKVGGGFSQLVRGQTNGNAQNNLNNIEGQNPVLINDDEDNTVYEQEEFEPLEKVNSNYVSNV